MPTPSNGRIPLKLNVTMSMATGSACGRYWRLCFEDRASGTRILEVEMTPEQFALALGSLHITKVNAVITSPAVLLDRVGKRRETKHENVVIGGAWGADAMMLVRENAREFEVDGWEAEALTTHNPHRVRNTSPLTYQVTFWRYVNPEEPSDA